MHDTSALPRQAIHPTQRRVWHFLEMLLAMSAGMLVLGPLEELFWSVPPERADLHLIVMAANMAVGMVVWMLVRRQAWGGAAVAGMAAPCLLLLVPYYLGVLDGDILITAGHVLMLPSMFLAARAPTARPAT